MEGAAFRRHIPEEAMHPLGATPALDTHSYSTSYGQDAADNGRRDNAIRGKAQGDGFTASDRRFQFLLRDALEQTLIVHSPSSANPVVRPYVLEHFYQGFFVAVAQVNRMR